MVSVIKMVKVLFVCLGNICRSPMAEGLFRKRVKDLGLDNMIQIESRGTSTYTVGKPPHPGTKEVLLEHDALFADMKAERITKQDFSMYDFIIGMDDMNMRDLKSLAGHHIHKLYKYLEICEDCNGRDIEDPYYTGQFDVTYQDLMLGINKWIDIFKKHANLN